MNTRFELLSDERGRISFCLVDSAGQVLLQGLPCNGKIAAQTEVLHARDALRAPELLVAKESRDNQHFVVLKDNAGNVLGRSREVATPTELEGLIAELATAGPAAAVIDQTRRMAPR